MGQLCVHGLPEAAAVAGAVALAAVGIVLIVSNLGPGKGLNPKI
jgi:hypothetical protein